MIMGLPLRCRYLSVLQLILIVTCHRGEGTNSPQKNQTQGCIGSQLSLRCPPMKVIKITGVVLGDSSCSGSSCCIKDDDCTRDANANHKADVQRRCNNKHDCTVLVLQEKIWCGWWLWKINNDFERIKYVCIDDTRNDTMDNSSYEAPTEDNNNNTAVEADVELETAQGCVGSQLSLRCEEMNVINVIHVVLGDSIDNGTVCNISYNNCIRNASENHSMDVHHRCDDRSNCTVHVIQEMINCGTLGSLSNSFFELIAYNCLNDSRDNFVTTDGTVTTKAGITNSNMQTIGIVIACIIILLIIIIVVVVMYRRRKGAQMKTRLDPVAMTDVDNNHQNEYAIYANETQGTNTLGDGYAQAMYSHIDESDSPKRDEHQIIYSEVELMETISKDCKTDRVTTSQKNAVAKQSSAQSDAGTVSKSHSPQDDGCQTVIENDLYGMADNCAVESPTCSLAGVVSKAPLSQDDEGLTVIENDIYCH